MLSSKPIYGEAVISKFWGAAGIDRKTAKGPWEAEGRRKTMLDAEAAVKAVLKEWGPSGQRIIDMNDHH
jgi:hypothetical protein